MASLGLIPRTAPIGITLSGSDPDLVMKAGNELKSVIGKIPGADNVRLFIVNPMGLPVEISQFATVEQDNSPFTHYEAERV